MTNNKNNTTSESQSKLTNTTTNSDTSPSSSVGLPYWFKLRPLGLETAYMENMKCVSNSVMEVLKQAVRANRLDLAEIISEEIDLIVKRYKQELKQK